MKIKKIETAWLSIESPEPQGLSGGYMTHSSDAVCRITTDDGIQGIGEGRGAPLPEICEIIHKLFTPLLQHENPLHIQYLWDRLNLATLDESGNLRKGLRSPSVRGALCAVDLALWDIKGRAAGMSVCELLGGKPGPIQAYIQKGFYVEGQSLSAMADEAVEVLTEGGFKHLKMRVGRGGVAEARERVEVMRKALGDDIGLMVDVNGAWELPEAIEGAHALEPYNLMWMEEPISRIPRTLPKEGYNWNEELGKLGQATTIPMAAGENHEGLYEFNDLIMKGKPKYMQLGVAKRSGGVSEWVKVAAICQANGILMAPHLVPQFHVHLVAAAPNGFILECGDNEKQHPSWPDLFPGWPVVKNGHVECPTSPGWGLAINDKMIREHGTILRWDF
ncbi:MAG: mandelate racemase/muconate lactonizing enzyme family protein [Spirochaetales bacterium]|nr:mandelate racemase/muconate lactonizing enzyme family protein [Spirochaetales bacterium]